MVKVHNPEQLTIQPATHSHHQTGPPLFGDVGYTGGKKEAAIRKRELIKAGKLMIGKRNITRENCVH